MYSPDPTKNNCCVRKLRAAIHIFFQKNQSRPPLHNFPHKFHLAAFLSDSIFYTLLAQYPSFTSNQTYLHNADSICLDGLVLRNAASCPWLSRNGCRFAQVK